MKRISAAIVMLIMICTSMCSMVFAVDIFPDLLIQQFDNRGNPLVDSNGEYIYKKHYATSEIMKSTQIDLIVGYEQENGTYLYMPEQAITKAEFIKMAMVLSTNSTFDFEIIPSDIEHWAGKYVKVAEMQNVVEKGEYTDSNLDEPITRLEMICILSKIQINMKGVEQNVQGKLHYTDIDVLTEEEKALLLHAAKYELLNQMLESNTFKPNQNLTRAEAAVAIMRVY